MDSVEQILWSGSKQINIELNSEQIKKLLNYLQLLIKWNKTYNLTAITEPDLIAKKHLLDSISIINYINDKKLIDVGSGAGLPSFIIAIIKPDLAITAIDSSAKKCNFMIFVKAHLNLYNVNIVNNRVENYYPDFCFGQVLSRAFASVEDTLKLTNHLLCDNGKYLLMKGDNFKKESMPDQTKIHKLFTFDNLYSRFLLEINK
jgi:16S rRNA (guanine527-N7)-methyltransferase